MLKFCKIQEKCKLASHFRLMHCALQCAYYALYTAVCILCTVHCSVHIMHCALQCAYYDMMQHNQLLQYRFRQTDLIIS